MRQLLLLAIVLGLAACSHDQPPPQYGSPQTTSGAIGSSDLTQPNQPGPSPVSAESAPGRQSADATAESTPNEWHADLLRSALELPSLTADQKSRVQALIDERKTADANIRAARAQLLGALADAISTGTVNRAAFAPQIEAVVAAVMADEPADRRRLADLHTLLAPSQRVELVTEVESAPRMIDDTHRHLGWTKKLDLTPTEEAQIDMNVRASYASVDADMADAREEHRALLEAFKGATLAVDQVDPPKSAENIRRWVSHVVITAEAAAPVLTIGQRTAAASLLRSWASKAEK